MYGVIILGLPTGVLSMLFIALIKGTGEVVAADSLDTALIHVTVFCLGGLLNGWLFWRANEKAYQRYLEQ